MRMISRLAWLRVAARCGAREVTVRVEILASHPLVVAHVTIQVANEARLDSLEDNQSLEITS